MPARRSAASTAFRNNIAMVVGPDAADPRRDPARDLFAGLVDVGEQLAALVANTAPHDHGPGPDVLGLKDPGNSGRRNHDLGPLRVARPIRYAGVHDRDRGVGGRALLRQEQRQRPAEREAAPEDHDLPARDRDLVVREQCLDARGRARHRSGHAEREPPEVDRVQPVDVFVGIHLEQRGLVVDLRRRRVLHEHRVDCGIVVERADRGDEVGLGRVLRKVNVRRGEADLGRLLLLHADVARARTVVADEDGRETGREAAVDERLDARLEVGERGLRRPEPRGMRIALNAGSAVRR